MRPYHAVTTGHEAGLTPVDAELTRADRVCGARAVLNTDRAVLVPSQAAPAIPAGRHTPTPLLMGLADRPLSDGERLLDHYYALQERATGGLLCAPSPDCGAAVVALYRDAADAVMARRDWFRGAFSEILCVPEFVSDLARVRVLTRAEALALRRREAEGRGEAWTFAPPLPAGPGGADRGSPPLSGWWPALLLAAALGLLALVHWLP